MSLGFMSGFRLLLEWFLSGHTIHRPCHAFCVTDWHILCVYYGTLLFGYHLITDSFFPLVLACSMWVQVDVDNGQFLVFK